METKKQNKNLLLITHAVDYDHSRTRFMCSWLEEFSKYHKKVNVICLLKGNVKGLPKNVIVHSLGKESKTPRFIQILKYMALINKLSNEYDIVFAHNYANWVTFGYPLFKKNQKPIFWWHCNKEKGIANYFGGLLCDRLFTHSKASFPYDFSKKMEFFGHGIDTSLFYTIKKKTSDKFKIITVGRLSHEKRFGFLAKAMRNMDNSCILEIVSSISNKSNIKGLMKLIEVIAKENVSKKVCFRFNVPNKDMNAVYNDSGLSVNLCETGALDKVVLESMAAGTLPLVCNRSFKPYFGKYWNILGFREDSYEDMLQKIKGIKKISKEKCDKIKKFLRDVVIKKHSVEVLIRDFEKSFDNFFSSKNRKQ
jgi:glycosyltransferase involved in cell wall biosynthesis